MNEDIIFNIVWYNFIIIFIIFFIKVVHFIMIKSKKKTFNKFLFYSESSINGTKDYKKKKQKKIQNILSVIILVLLLSQILIFLSGAMFKRKIED